MKRYCIYSRKSKATEKGESIDNQIQTCKDYIHRIDPDADLEKDVDVYIDDGFSGKNTNRPQFQQMTERIKKRQYSALVCYRLDRISRNVCDFVVCINEFSKYGVSFISVNEGFDTSTPLGRTMMYIASVFAEMERETIAERVRDNMYALSFTGRWLGGKTPYGFDSKRISYQSHNGTTKFQSVLVPNNDELSVVETIFYKYLELGSLVAVQKLLAQSGVRTRNGMYFSDSAIKSILMNPCYCRADKDAYEYFLEHGSSMPDGIESQFDGEHGMMPFNRHKGDASVRPINEWVIAVGDHEGIIPGEVYIAACNKLNENRLRYENENSYAANDYALLSGIVFCKKCGSRMYTQKNDKKKTGDYFAYICDTRKTFGAEVCDCKYLNGRIADELVIEELMKYNNDDSEIKKSLLALSDSKARVARAQSMVALYTKQIEDKKAAIKALVMRLATGNIDSVVSGYISEQINVLDSEVKDLECMIRDENEHCEEISSSLDESTHYMEVLESLNSLTDLDSKRAAIREVVNHVEWDGEHIDLFYKWRT